MTNCRQAERFPGMNELHWYRLFDHVSYCRCRRLPERDHPRGRRFTARIKSDVGEPSRRHAAICPIDDIRDRVVLHANTIDIADAQLTRVRRTTDRHPRHNSALLSAISSAVNLVAKPPSAGQTSTQVRRLRKPDNRASQKAGRPAGPTNPKYHLQLFLACRRLDAARIVRPIWRPGGQNIVKLGCGGIGGARRPFRRRLCRRGLRPVARADGSW